jgi:hypothetical protein
MTGTMPASFLQVITNVGFVPCAPDKGVRSSGAAKSLNRLAITAFPRRQHRGSFLKPELDLLEEARRQVSDRQKPGILERPPQTERVSRTMRRLRG